MTSPVRANALALPLGDESVDLIVTSPPYFALRSYRDGDEHFDGQIGSEATPTEFLDALLAATAEMVRVTKPSGSIFVNLGDKYAGSGGHNNNGISAKSTLAGNGHIGGGPKIKATRRTAPDRYNQTSDVPAKSLMGLPWRYANRVVDDLGLVLRQEIIWSKPNGLPESVTDRCRRSHEQIFHFTKQGRYYAAVDEVREGYAPASVARGTFTPSSHKRQREASRISGGLGTEWSPNSLGKLPGSVWTIPSEPLKVPDEFPEHFAAFPQEIPRRLILGWSPKEICTGCGQGKRPVVDREYLSDGDSFKGGTAGEGRHRSGLRMGDGIRVAVTGYECGCDGTAPTRPGVVLDPFGGTGTTAMVARALGRIGVSVDLSHDYCRLAKWRIFESGDWAKLFGQPKKREISGQGDLFGQQLPEGVHVGDRL